MHFIAMSLIYSFVRVSEGEGESGSIKVSSEKRVLRNSSVKKTPQGSFFNRTPSSKKRPQPFNASDAEFQHGGEEEEGMDFGDNYNDDDNEFEGVTDVGEEEHEGSGSFVKAEDETGNSGKEDSKKVQKSEKKADVKLKLKPRQLKTGSKTRTQTRGALVRRAVSKDDKGVKKMHVVPLKDLNEKV